MGRKSGVGLTIGPEFVTMVRVTRSGSGRVVEAAVRRPIPEPRGEGAPVEADGQGDGHHLLHNGHLRLARVRGPAPWELRT